MRDPFFRSLATELERYPETGVGLVFRVGSQLQREFLRPPSGHMPVLSRNTGGREPGVISSVTAAGYFFRYHSARSMHYTAIIRARLPALRMRLSPGL
jgi:hypothetical protein